MSWTDQIKKTPQYSLSPIKIIIGWCVSGYWEAQSRTEFFENHDEAVSFFLRVRFGWPKITPWPQSVEIFQTQFLRYR